MGSWRPCASANILLLVEIVVGTARICGCFALIWGQSFVYPIKLTPWHLIMGHGETPSFPYTTFNASHDIAVGIDIPSHPMSYLMSSTCHRVPLSILMTMSSIISVARRPLQPMRNPFQHPLTNITSKAPPPPSSNTILSYSILLPLLPPLHERPRQCTCRK